MQHQEFRSTISGELWRNTPCSMNYVIQNPSMNKAPKFQRGSIYFRDQVDKPKKVFDDFEKPEQLLTQFRNQLKEVNYLKQAAQQKKKQPNEKQKAKSLSRVTKPTQTYLYQIPDKIEYKYDRNGWRSNYVGDYNVKAIEDNVMRKKKSFSFGRRSDLSKPLNFYPGPGTYNQTHLTFSETTALRKTSMGFTHNPQSLNTHRSSMSSRKPSLAS